jgi:hypothetical protein
MTTGTSWVPPERVVRALGYLLERGLPLETSLILMVRAYIITVQEKYMIQAKVICIDAERQKRRLRSPDPKPPGGGGGLESPEARARRQIEQRIKDNELVRKLYKLDQDK